MFVERYGRLHDIAQTVIQELTPNGVEVDTSKSVVFWMLT